MGPRLLVAVEPTDPETEEKYNGSGRLGLKPMGAMFNVMSW